jgi:hypothetical protein
MRLWCGCGVAASLLWLASFIFLPRHRRIVCLESVLCEHCPSFCRYSAGFIPLGVYFFHVSQSLLMPLFRVLYITIEACPLIGTDRYHRHGLVAAFARDTSAPERITVLFAYYYRSRLVAFFTVAHGFVIWKTKTELEKSSSVRMVMLALVSRMISAVATLLRAMNADLAAAEWKWSVALDMCVDCALF